MKLKLSFSPGMRGCLVDKEISEVEFQECCNRVSLSFVWKEMFDMEARDFGKFEIFGRWVRLDVL